MKNPAPITNSKYRQGLFKPINPSKCINLVSRDKRGELVYNPPIYRSGYELRFMRWADENQNVRIWGVEVCAIEYTSRLAIMEGKNPKRKYFIDFYVELVNPDGSITKRLIEIKPESQCSEPKPPKKKTKKALDRFVEAQKTWLTNEDKWKHAIAFASSRGMDFKVMHEGHLF